MTICYFGTYDPSYARNKVIIDGLRKKGVKVIECRTDKKRFKKYPDLIKKHFKIKDEYDLMIVGYAGYSRSNILLAKILSRKSIIWDAFFSLYDTMVYDRKKVRQRSIYAIYYWFLDWINSKLSDRILLDTNEHIEYFSKEFGIKRGKFIRVLVGSNDSIFYPRNKKSADDKFKVLFWGNFIPLQGVQYIVRAAKILEDSGGITFKIIGKGQTYNAVRKEADELNLRNTEFIDRIPVTELPEHIRRADICLGIFGDTDKMKRVIPNKVYEAAAMKKAVITADTPAIRELFTNREDILLCGRANPNDLADKIMELKNNSDLREKISSAGYELFLNTITPSIIAKGLIAQLFNEN